ncbi:hypothetical protein [Xylanimonas protaetiae]|uniref:hypothetical protein n=1 Tax=Xylanimonas protaetiae TaxID=2509457 RepID=UPI00315A855F
MTATILAQVVVAPDAYADTGVDEDVLRGACAGLLAAFAAAAEPFADHVDEATAWRRRNPNANQRERETLDDAAALVARYAAA